MAVPPVGHAPRPHSDPGAALQIPDGSERLTGPPVLGVARFDLLLADRAAEPRLESLERHLSVDGDEPVELPGELPLEHRRRRGLLDMVAKRLQQPRRASHRGPALRIVEVILRAWPVEHADPELARVGTDFLPQRARQRRRVVGLARHACTDHIQHTRCVTYGARYGSVDYAACPSLPDHRALAHPATGRLEPNKPALARRDTGRLATRRRPPAALARTGSGSRRQGVG